MKRNIAFLFFIFYESNVSGAYLDGERSRCQSPSKGILERDEQYCSEGGAFASAHEYDQKRLEDINTALAQINKYQFYSDQSRKNSPLYSDDIMTSTSSSESISSFVRDKTVIRKKSKSCHDLTKRNSFCENAVDDTVSDNVTPCTVSLSSYGSLANEDTVILEKNFKSSQPSLITENENFQNIDLQNMSDNTYRQAEILQPISRRPSFLWYLTCGCIGKRTS